MSGIAASPDGYNALAPWLQEVFSSDDQGVTWEQAANALFEVGAVITDEQVIAVLRAVRSVRVTAPERDAVDACIAEVRKLLGGES